MEDPVRMIRAARFAGSLNFNIDINDFDSICRNKELKTSSPSRMYDEVQKLFFADKPNEFITGLKKLN